MTRVRNVNFLLFLVRSPTFVCRISDLSFLAIRDNMTSLVRDTSSEYHLDTAYSAVNYLEQITFRLRADGGSISGNIMLSGGKKKGRCPSNEEEWHFN